MLVFTAVLAAAGIVNAVIINRQLDVMSQQLKQMERAGRLDQRPWIVDPALLLSGEPEENQSIDVGLTIVNHGKSPALNVITQSRFLISESEPLMSAFELCESGRSTAVLAPGEASTTFKLKPRALAIKEAAIYRAKQANLYVHAIVRYKDIFQISHWTTLCMYHVYGEGLGTFHYCGHGNDMDSD